MRRVLVVTILLVILLVMASTQPIKHTTKYLSREMSLISQIKRLSPIIRNNHLRKVSAWKNQREKVLHHWPVQLSSPELGAVLDGFFKSHISGQEARRQIFALAPELEEFLGDAYVVDFVERSSRVMNEHIEKRIEFFVIGLMNKNAKNTVKSE